MLSACAPHKIYRQELALCTSSTPEAECESNALQEYQDAAQPDKTYLLGFIEFDDQGQIFDRRQMDAVVRTLYERSASEDLLMVVFVHGWKHSAAPRDDNIRTFREALEQLSELESNISRQTGAPQRQVVGVYLGWRGGSITVPGVKELTFWDRKNTAHKVGNGGVTEVLNRIDLVRKTRDSISDAGRSRTRLVVVGHSFGGAVVYSALHQILDARFVHTVGPAGQVSDTRGFGDLVVLINPAFEALLYTPLSDMSTERGRYFASQLPVLVILTSEADDATGRAFPIGRWFSTFFEKERDMTRKNATTGAKETIDEGKANITAVGHFEPYRTHYLRATQPSPETEPRAPSVEADVELFFKTSQSWESDAPGSRILFLGSVLERSEDSAGRNPYLVVRVDEELIGDHNDIDDPRIASFIRQLILISAQSPDPKERQLMRSRALGR
jgi:pimeloyl-ACP methyl ester carboxylesterase